ncbi:MAG: cyclic nucleotide-binding domain-containing protein [Gammaproteobacteria bacterium]
MQESDYLIDRDGLFEKFKKFPFLGSIDDSFLNDMLELSKMRKYKANEVIAREGEYDSVMYIIITGRVKVIKNGEQIAHFIEQGDTFGELAIIDGETRSATVKAEVDSICLAIDASFIDRVKPEKRDAFCSVFYRLIAEVLTRRLRLTSEELIRTKEDLARIRAGKYKATACYENLSQHSP